MNEFFSEYIHTVSNVACVLHLPLKEEKKKIKPLPATRAISDVRVTFISNRRQEG